MPRTLDRFTLGEPIVEADIFNLLLATESLPGGEARPVLLKVFTHVKDEGRTTQTRISAELKAFSKIGTAPHLITLLSAGVTDHIPWMAFSAGTSTLAAQISDTPSSPEEILRVIRETARALEAVHASALLHNDVKPVNIISTNNGYALADLSLAAGANVEITQQAEMVRFAAPEVFSREYGKLTPSTDLYALGHIAYEMALGSRAWRGQFPQVFEAGWRPKDGVNPAKWMAWHCSSQTRLPLAHEINKSFPPQISDLLAKLTIKDANQRFKSAGEVGTALRVLITPGASPIPIAAKAASQPAGVNPAARSTVATAAAPGSPPPAPMATPGATAAAGGSGTYYVRLRNKQSGPYDFATLQRQAKTGLVSRLHQVSSDGINWRPATAVDGLFSS